MEEEIVVSVFCLAYNHEHYIRDTLEGFVRQKTNFKFEVLVHDDASTDGTADIIREYEERYPDIIKPIYQTENQYSKEGFITWRILYPRARGRYIALCDGDDCWIDLWKLNKQIDYMEEHPECMLCATRTMRCDHETGKCTIYPGQRGTRQYTIEETIRMAGIFATASYCLRKEVYASMPKPFFSRTLMDWQISVYSAFCGEAHCLHDVTAVYNRKAKGSTSAKRWTDAKHKEHSQKYRTNFNEGILAAAERMDAYFEHKYHQDFWQQIAYYRYHVCKHRSRPEEIQGPEYDEFRLIDHMRKVTAARNERIAREAAGEPAPPSAPLPDRERWPDDQPIEVTVFCLARNQKDYIRETLDGFLAQRTGFRFEVLVHDAASTDGTADIIREYAEKYPDMIRPVYGTESLEGQYVSIVREKLLPLARGRYFAWCGGYSSWIDPDKLQKQYDFMEANPAYGICTHRTVGCNVETEKCGIEPGNRWSTTRDYTAEDLITFGQLLSATSFFVRRHIYEEIPEELAARSLETWQVLINGAMKGGCHCLWDVMAINNSKVPGSFGEKVLADQALRTASNERRLMDMEKMRAFFGPEYDELFVPRFRYYTYHICKHTGRLDEIQGEEYEEYRLIDRMRKAVRKKMEELGLGTE